MEGCLLSLKHIQKMCKSIVPALVALENTAVILNRCLIRGNAVHETVGAILKKADILLKEVKITQFSLGGLQIYCGAEKIVKVANCTVRLL